MTLTKTTKTIKKKLRRFELSIWVEDFNFLKANVPVWASSRENLYKSNISIWVCETANPKTNYFPIQKSLSGSTFHKFPKEKKRRFTMKI